MIGAIAEASARRPKVVLVMWAALLAVAAYRAAQLDFDALPDVTGNQVQILTRASGLTPEEVELRVTRPIEAALGGLPGLTLHRSTSRYGLSAVVALFADDVDAYRARQLVAEKLASVAAVLPAGVEAPELGPLSGGLGEIYHLVLRASPGASPPRSGAELLELATYEIAPILRSVPGVVEVNTWGGERRRFEVVADATRLAAHGLGLGELQAAVARAVGVAAGDAVAGETGQVLVRGDASVARAADLAPIVVPSAGNGREDGAAPALVRVGDVATLRDGAAPRIGAATADGGGEVVYVMAQMLRGANARDVTRAIAARLPEVRRALPPDVTLDLVYDRATLVDATLHTVGRSLLEGGLLVVAVLLLTLGSLRAGLLVALAIPVAMLGAAAVMRELGVGGNLMSLGALDFGLLVDGAVVMVEYVFHAQRHADGTPDPELVPRAASRVARPVFAAVAVIILVYVPVLALSGVEGKMYRPMAITVVLALIAALAFALTLAPAVLALAGPRWVPARDPLLIRWIDRAYAAVLPVVTRRWPVVVAAALALLAGAGALFSRAGTELAPQLDEGDLVIQTTRAPDLRIDEAVAASTAMEAALRARIPEIRQIVSRLGSPAIATDTMGVDQADVFVALHPRARWRPGLSRDQLIAEMTAVIDEATPGSEPAFTQPIQMRFNELVGGSSTDVVLAVVGDDLPALWQVARAAVAELTPVSGVADARVLAPPEVRLIEVRPDPVGAAQLGLDPGEVLTAVTAIRLGVQVAETLVGPRVVPVVLRLGDPTPTAASLGELGVPVPGGAVAPLGELATLTTRAVPASIAHEGGKRRLVIGFNVRGQDLGTALAAARARVDRLALPTGVHLEWGGQFQALSAAKARLAIVIPGVMLLILMVLGFTFEHMRPALIVFSHVPFACVGGIAALALRQLPLSMAAVVGFIALSGIAVMNGVVLMSEITARERAGQPAREAAQQAARSRCRAVTMTAMVAAFGFVPMMLASGVGAEVQRPLATVVFGGLITSTTLTLIVLPAIYPLLAGRRRATRLGGLGGLGGPEATP